MAAPQAGMSTRSCFRTTRSSEMFSKGLATRAPITWAARPGQLHYRVPWTGLLALGQEI